jgi:hypothetical protein
MPVKRRQGTEPPKVRVKTYAEKLFEEGDLLQLEMRKSNDTKLFKIFNDHVLFPELYKDKNLMPIKGEEKHDECDYETEPEHVGKARELMLEDLFDSIKFFVEEQPLDLVHNIQRTFK